MFILKFYNFKNRIFQHDQDKDVERLLVYDADIHSKIQEKDKGWIDRAQIRLNEQRTDINHSIIAFDTVNKDGSSFNLITINHFISSDTFNYLLSLNSQKIEIAVTINSTQSQKDLWKFIGPIPQWDSSISSVEKIDRFVLQVIS